MNPSLAIIAPISLLILVILAGLFLASRLNLYFGILSLNQWRLLTYGLVFGSLISMIAFTTTPLLIGRAIFMFSSLSVGLVLFFLIGVLVVEAFHLALPISPKLRGMISLSFAILMCSYGIWNASRPVVKKVTIPISGLTEKIRAVHLTDIHLGNFRGKRFLDRVIQKTRELEPEVIFHTGDLFDAKAPMNENTLASFGNMDAPHFFVEGNHDIEVGLQEVFDLASEQNFTILENEISAFRGLQIVGLKYMLADTASFDIHASAEKETIADVLARLPIDEHKPTIALHHSPMGFQYAEKHGVDLMLAGHTHGGQIWPLTYIANSIFPYNRGLFRYENLAIYVSEGIGTMFTPMRIGTQSEITLLELVPPVNEIKK